MIESRGFPPFAKSAKDGAPGFSGLKMESWGSLEFLEKGSELATASR
jgi:hypothetical protein